MDRINRLRDIVAAASRLPRVEWDPYLRSACGEDADLLREARDLLSYHSPETMALENVGADLLEDVAADLGPVSAGQRFGPYEVVEMLGSGSMGLVWRARRRDPDREVALKVLRGSLDDDGIRARMFEREIGTLARLSHPGIAALLESGRTPQGRAWFTMELVDGVRFDEWVHETPDRELVLDVFRQICAAVTHAHQAGVMHRDLKPTNILVVSTPEGPQAKVLDFGLARLMEDSDLNVTRAESGGGLKGTLNYMSPEQAEGRTDLDTRSDVYALGVILFEALSGTLPYDLPSSSLLAATRAIVETRPRRLEETGRHDADLGQICAKALARDPEQRYSGADALARDLLRFRNNEPIEARPPSATYLFSKFVERNRLVVAASALVLVILVAATVGLGRLYLVSQENLERALAAEGVAVNETRNAEEVIRFLVELFESNDPAQGGGQADVTARELLQRGADRVANDLGGQPAVRARLQETVGRVYRSIGSYEEAEAQLELALATRRDVSGYDDLEVGHVLAEMMRLRQDAGDLAAADSLAALVDEIYGRERPDDRELRGEWLSSLSRLHLDQYRYDEAERTARESLEIGNATGLSARQRGDRIGDLALVYQYQGRHEEALPLRVEELELAREVDGEESPEYAITAANLAAIYTSLERHEDALPLYVRSLEVIRGLYGEDHPYVAGLLQNQAWSLVKAGRPRDALTVCEEAMDAYLRAVGPEHPNYARAVSNYADTWQRVGEPAVAREHFEHSLRIRETAYGPDHVRTAQGLVDLAECVLELDQTEEARGYARRACDILKAADATDSPWWKRAEAILQRDG